MAVDARKAGNGCAADRFAMRFLRTFAIVAKRCRMVYLVDMVEPNLKDSLEYYKNPLREFNRSTFPHEVAAIVAVPNTNLYIPINRLQDHSSV